ncbi:signal peptide peptidase-like 2A isoform X1 [Entelurus aequoreus]|uniref:signal peptide peptidase-like 2A isoform X1 n=2 Tax=Entelurus aequoreus TaxID=161455 RepID=UPI002B1D2DC8|nr:signal peptide peptidase-like 2A isoform X1 [Entelurus aequoreus]
MERSALLVVWVFIAVLTTQINCQEGVLHISNGSITQEFCIVYNNSWTPLPQTLNDAVQYPLVNMTSTILCDPSGVSPEVVEGKALVVMRGDCAFSQKAQVAQNLGAAVLLIASNNTLVVPSADDSEYAKVQIPVTLMRYRDFLEAQQVFDDGMQARLYAPKPSKLDSSIFVMLLISVITVALGGYWSGACEREHLNSGFCSRDSPNSGPGQISAEDKADSEDSFLTSPLKVLIFVALMCSVLVLMYYFYNILVYFFIAMFSFASASALFSCCDAVLEKLGCPSGSFTIRNTNLSVRGILLAAVCISISVVWVVYRNEDRWIWMLHNLLSIVFCLHFIKNFPLPNFKICVILLSLLLIYDIFFVFITPFFTKNGVSLMMQVVLGPDASGERTQGNMVNVPAEPQTTTEKIPIAMRVPRFSAWAQNVCQMQFAILGFGDLIVPGLLVAYCSRFDVWINSKKKVYFLSSWIAYLLGMITTIAVMLLSDMAQPALLYLVPFTLITSAAVAGCRGEIRHFWAGTCYEVLDSSREPLLPDARTDCPVETEQR